MYFLVLQSSQDEVERDGCFAFKVFLMSCFCKCHVPWDGLQFVIVQFPDYTHLLSNIQNTTKVKQLSLSLSLSLSLFPGEIIAKLERTQMTQSTAK